MKALSCEADSSQDMSVVKACGRESSVADDGERDLFQHSSDGSTRKILPKEKNGGEQNRRGLIAAPLSIDFSFDDGLVRDGRDTKAQSAQFVSEEV